MELLIIMHVSMEYKTAKTYQQAAYELQRNGYATDPDYASKLIYAIKKFNLAQYDNVK